MSYKESVLFHWNIRLEIWGGIFEIRRRNFLQAKGWSVICPSSRLSIEWSIHPMILVCIQYIFNENLLGTRWQMWMAQGMEKHRMPEKQIQEQKGIWWTREGGRAEWCYGSRSLTRGSKPMLSKMWSQSAHSLIIICKIFIYVAALGLCRIMRDLCCGMQTPEHVGSVATPWYVGS